jgi:hypothetical protein
LTIPLGKLEEVLSVVTGIFSGKSMDLRDNYLKLTDLEKSIQKESVFQLSTGMLLPDRASFFTKLVLSLFIIYTIYYSVPLLP